MTDLQVFDCTQGEPEWHLCRLGIPTASKFSDVLAKGQGITRRKYLYQLAGEILTGERHEGYSNQHMERGKEQEDEARKLYQLIYGGDLTSVGFMRRGDAGASPDSLVGDDGLLEVKTRLPHLQVELLATYSEDKPPAENITQVQGQMAISGRSWCDLISYCRGLPLARWQIARDEAFIGRLWAEIDAFNEELTQMVTKIRGMA